MKLLVGQSFTVRGRRLPPLWLAAATVAATWVAAFGIAGWLVLFVQRPVHMDFRIFFVAAEAGVRYGWSSIYDVTTLRMLSSGFPNGQNGVEANSLYVNPPLLAWLVAPLTAFPYAVAYAIWTAVSLAAFVWSWWITSSWSAGIARVTLLIAGLALWPVIDDLYFGQSCLLILALVAAAWWLCRRDRQLAAGFALAVATMLKPQDIFVVPFALLASGRVRPFVGWIVGCAALTVLFVLSLGPAGLQNWAAVLAYRDPSSQFTANSSLSGPFALGIEGVQAALAIVIAWRKRGQLEMVFAAGLVGSIAASFFLHQSDYSLLVLAAWLILRTAPSRVHRAWLVAGVASMQAVSLAIPAPQLIWNAAWLVALALSSFAGSTRSAASTRQEAALDAIPGR